MSPQTRLQRALRLRVVAMAVSFAASPLFAQDVVSSLSAWSASVAPPTPQDLFTAHEGTGTSTFIVRRYASKGELRLSSIGTLSSMTMSGDAFTRFVTQEQTFTLAEAANVVIPMFATGTLSFTGGSSGGWATNYFIYDSAGVLKAGDGMGGPLDADDMFKYFQTSLPAGTYKVRAKFLISGSGGRIDPGDVPDGSTGSVDFNTGSVAGMAMSIAAYPAGLTSSRAAVKAPDARSMFGLDGTGIRVGVVEPGESYTTHSSLMGRVFAMGGPEPGTFTEEHTLAVAGIIASADPDPANAGIAPNATIYSASTLKTGSLLNAVASLTTGASAVQVLNVSAVGGATATDLNKLINDHPTLSFVESSGNTAGAVPAPAGAENIITVGAVNRTFTSVADFSSYGTGGALIKPDIVAPGEYINAPQARDTNVDGMVNDFGRVFLGDDFRYDFAQGALGPANTGGISGTSFAAPHVSGAAALLYQYQNENPNHSIDHRVIKAVLLNSASTTVKDLGGAAWNQASSGTFGTGVGSAGLTITRSLDAQTGAGMLDTLQAVKQYEPDEVNPGSSNADQSLNIDVRPNLMDKPLFWDLENVVKRAAPDDGTVDYLLGAVGTKHIRATLTWDKDDKNGRGLQPLEFHLFEEGTLPNDEGHGPDDISIAQTMKAGENVKLFDFTIPAPITDGNPNFYLEVDNAGSFGALYGLAVSLTTPVPGMKWKVNASGLWSVPTNWEGPVPNAVDAIANFTDAIGAPRTVTVDAPQTVGVINFDNANSYTIAGGAPITIAATAVDGQINVVSGSHEISAPLMLASTTTVTVSPAGSTLTVSGPVSSAPLMGLTKSGPGKLVLSGLNSFDGGLKVFQGIASVSSDGNLGASAGTVTLDSTFGTSPTLQVTSSFGTSRPILLDNVGAADALSNCDINVPAGVTFGVTSAITGPGYLHKTGSGTLGLGSPSGNSFGNAFAALVIDGGKVLALNSSGVGTGTGVVAVHGGGILGGNGSAGTVGVSSGGHVAPGVTPGGPGNTLAIAALSLASGSQLDVDLTTAGAPGGPNDLIAITAPAAGALTLAPTVVNLNAYIGTHDLPNGSYTLVIYPVGALIGTTAGWTIGTSNVNFPHTYSFSSASPGMIQLIVGAGGTPPMWAVNASGSWSVGSNWTAGIPSGAGALANFGSVITSPKIVTVDGAFSVGKIFFGNASSYTLADDGVAGHGITLDNSPAPGFITDSAGSHTITAPLTIPLGASITVSSAANTLTLSGTLTTGASSAVSVTGPGTLTISGAQSHGVGATFTTTSGVTNFNTDAGAGGANLTVHADPSTINFNATQHLASVIIDAGSVVKLTSGADKKLVTAALSVDSAGKLDLFDNDMIVKSGPVASIAVKIASGFDGGDWLGLGITSTSAAGAAGSAHPTALGYSDASSIGVTSFSGESVVGTDILVRYTLSGDANIDGIVNALDFNALASNFGGSGEFWVQADFNYDGITNTLDFNALASNFNLALPAPALGSLIPEPTAVALATFAVFVLAPRRRC